MISHRLFREHCGIAKGFFVKNLSKLGRSLKNVIIIDNTPSSYSLHPSNGIPINTWISSKNDIQLKELIHILEILADVPDVRLAIKKIVKKGKIDYENALHLLNSNKYSKRVDKSFEDRNVKETVLKHSNSQASSPIEYKGKSKSTMKEILSKSFYEEHDESNELDVSVGEAQTDTDKIEEPIEESLKDTTDSPKKSAPNDEPYRIPIRLASSDSSKTAPEIIPDFELSNPPRKPHTSRHQSKTIEDSTLSRSSITSQTTYKKSYETPIKTIECNSEKYKKSLQSTIGYTYGNTIKSKINDLVKESKTTRNEYYPKNLNQTYSYAKVDSFTYYSPSKEKEKYIPERSINRNNVSGLYHHAVKEPCYSSYSEPKSLSSIYNRDSKIEYKSYNKGHNTWITQKIETGLPKAQISTPISRPYGVYPSKSSARNYRWGI